MSNPSVVFDVPSGHVKLCETPSLVLPMSVVGGLAMSAEPAQLREVGRGIADVFVDRAKAQLGSEGLLSSPSVLARILTETWASMGLGHIALERWGKALTVHVSGAITDEPTLGVFVLGIIERILALLTLRPVHAMMLDQADKHWRVLIASETTCKRAETLVSSGLSFADVLVQLHEPESRS